MTLALTIPPGSRTSKRRAEEPWESTELSDLVRAHLDWCYQRNLRPGYIGRHHQALNRAERTTGPLETATTEIVREWYDSLGRLTAGTRAVELSHISSYCKWLVREGHRHDDPTIRLG